MGKRDISVMIGGIFFLLFLFFVFFRPDLEDVSGKTSLENILPTDGLVLRYDFEPSEISGNDVNDLKGGHTATIYGTVQSATGRYGDGLLFRGEGGDYLKVISADDIKGGQDLSISFWVKVGGSMPRIVYKSEGAVYSDYNISYDSDKFACGVRNNLVKAAVESGSISDVTAWHHVVCVLDLDETNSKIVLYVDGNAEEVFVDKNSFRLSNSDLFIAQGSPGRIDSFRIYNKVLSAAEVSALSQDLSTDIALRFDFDAGSGSTVADSSGNSNTGTITGATWVDGISGKALSFDGDNDYVVVSHHDSINFGGTAYSISFWYKTSQTAEHDIITKWEGVSNTYPFALRNNNGRVYFYTYGGGNAVVSGCSGGSLSDGKWHFIVAQRDSTNQRIYCDGVGGAVSSSSGDISNTDDLYIGVRGNLCCDFNGVIDELIIYNKILSEQEITDLYESFSVPLTTFNFGVISLADSLNNISSSNLRGNVSFGVSNDRIDNNSFINLTIKKTGFESSKRLYIQQVMNVLGVSGSAYSNVGGYAAATGYDAGIYSLDISNFGLSLSGSGTYNLNMSVSISNGNFYSKSKSITVTNRPPILSATIPNQTWAKGSNNINAIDLDNYFSDPDGDVLSYYFTGNSDLIVIGFNGDGTVNLTQPANYTGNATIRFTVSDGILSNQSNLVNLVVDGNATCVPMWSSGNWSDCSVDGLKTRIVTDLNNCGVVTGKPSTNQTCTYIPTGDQGGTVPPGGASGEGGVITKEKPKKEKEESFFKSKVFVSGLIVFIFAGAILGVYLVQRYRKREIVVTEEPMEKVVAETRVEKPRAAERKLRPVYEEPENISEMRDYVNGMMDKGGGVKEIKDALINAGWDKNDVENGVNLVVLERFVKSRIKTMSKEEIRKVLVSKGWGKDIVESVLKGL